MLTRCIWCGKKPIKIKKNFLCIRCYQKFITKGTPGPIRDSKIKKKEKRCRYVPKDITYKRAKTIKNLINKYGITILQDFIALSSKPFWSLTDFAAKYGFSRENARIIHLRLTGRPFQEISTKKTEIVNKDIGCIHDPRRKFAEYKRGDNNRWKGTLAEKLFFEGCKIRNIPTEIPCDGEIDLKVNGYFVDVKSCFNPCFTTIDSKIPHMRFMVSEKQRKKCYFIACYHGIEKQFFIIPTDVMLKSNCIYILEKRSDWGCAKNRYWEYKNAWNLLRK